MTISVTTLAHASTPVQSILPNGLPMTQFKLPNGLNIFVIENHTAPVFSYQTWFNVGSKDEVVDPNIGKSGLAHLFEHMMFRGTTQFPDGQFDEILARSGAHDENASTWVDRTNYYENLPSSQLATQLATVMQLESDRMANLVINADLLATEKSAVVGEYNMGLDDPTTVAYDHLYATAYTAHPYRYSTIGTLADINSFTMGQANYFYKKYYAPSNATLLIVGDVNPTTVLATAQQYYGMIPFETVEHLNAPVEPAQTAERSVRFQHPQLQNQRLMFGHHIPGVAHADFPALWVLMSALTYGNSSILQMSWVNSGIAISVSGDINQFKDPGLFIISAEIQSGRATSDVESILDQQLKTLTTSGADSILARAKNQLLLRIYSQLEDNGSMASFLGEYIPTTGDPTFIFNLITQIQNVKSADIARVIKAYIQPSNRTVVMGSPLAPSEKLQ